MSGINFEQWDKDLETCDGTNCQSLMATMNDYYRKYPNDIEVVWRQCKSLFWDSLNYDQENIVKEKIIFALNIGEKALEIDPQHYSANLWVTNCAGKLVLLEGDMALKFKYIKNFLKSYKVLEIADKNDPLFYFIGARLQMAIYRLTIEERTMIEEGVRPSKLPPLDLDHAEQLLLRAIEINYNFLDAYHTLVYLYTKTGRYKDALKCVRTALSIVQTKNAAQKALFNELVNVQAILEKEFGEQKN